MISKILATVQKLKNKSQIVDFSNVLVEKPWTLVDENGSVQRLIFRSNKELILAVDGNVQIGSWDYYPEAKCILIDRVVDKVLCSEMYVDDCVIVLKKDGKNNELFLLANANKLPTLDILGYLSSKVNLLNDNPLNTISKASECSMYTVKKGNNSIKNVKVFFGDQIIKEGVLFENGYIYDIVPNQIIQARDGVVFNIFEKISKTSNNGENLEIYVSGSRVSKGDFVFINGVKANDGAYKTGVFSSIKVIDGRVV